MINNFAERVACVKILQTELNYCITLNELPEQMHRERRHEVKKKGSQLQGGDMWIKILKKSLV